MLILAFEANSALSHVNETKIVKITHSEMCAHQKNVHKLLGTLDRQPIILSATMRAPCTNSYSFFYMFIYMELKYMVLGRAFQNTI